MCVFLFFRDHLSVAGPRPLGSDIDNILSANTCVHMKIVNYPLCSLVRNVLAHEGVAEAQAMLFVNGF